MSGPGILADNIANLQLIIDKGDGHMTPEQIKIGNKIAFKFDY